MTQLFKANSSHLPPAARRLLPAVCFVLLWAAPFAAQNKQPPPVSQDDDEIIRVETTEIQLPVTVRDAQGRLLSGLTRDDFRVWEDGREQPLSTLVLRETPVDVVLMVDASSSVAANLDDFRQAADAFAQKLAPEDRLSLIKFADRVELLLDWTTNRAQLRRALSRLQSGMFTNFNDALYLAAREQLTLSRDRRRAVLVLSDGIDSGRGYATFAATLKALLEAQAGVYVVSSGEMARRDKQEELDALLNDTAAHVRLNELRINDLREGLKALADSRRRLQQLTAETGGQLFEPASFSGLESVYQDVAEELRNQYVLYYSPTNKQRDGQFRQVRVQTKQPGLSVTARRGYYAPKARTP